MTNLRGIVTVLHRLLTRDAALSETLNNAQNHESDATPIDVILPIYREATEADRIIDAILAYAAGRSDLHFILVDDGSPDDTASALQKRLDRVGTSQIKLLAYQPNRGKGYAIQQGITASTAPLVMFMDGDLAYSLDHIELVRDALGDADVVMGSRWLADNAEANRRGVGRRVMGESFNFLARVMCGLNYPDTQAGLKGFRRDAADAIFKRLTIYRYAFDVEVLYLAKRLGYSIEPVAARVSPQHAVQPTSINLISDPLNMFGDLIKIRWNAMRGRYR